MVEPYKRPDCDQKSREGYRCIKYKHSKGRHLARTPGEEHRWATNGPTVSDRTGGGYSDGDYALRRESGGWA